MVMKPLRHVVQGNKVAKGAPPSELLLISQKFLSWRVSAIKRRLRVEGWVICLLRKHEDMSLDYQSPYKKLGIMT